MFAAIALTLAVIAVQVSTNRKIVRRSDFALVFCRVVIVCIVGTPIALITEVDLCFARPRSLPDGLPESVMFIFTSDFFYALNQPTANAAPTKQNWGFRAFSDGSVKALDLGRISQM